MKYYQFKYKSKIFQLLSHLGTVVGVLIVPPFIVTLIFCIINILFRSLAFPDATLGCLILGTLIFSIAYIIRYFALLKGVFLYDDTLEIVDGSWASKKYKVFDTSAIVSIEWAGNFRKAPHAHWRTAFTQGTRMFALLFYCLTRKPLSNFFGGSSNDCIEIGIKTEKGIEYIYVSVAEQIDFMRDVKAKMLEHGNYNPDEDEYE
ncbi:MAG: hypothetical protein ACI4IG_05160 [Eubacterium sp.]